MTRTLIPTDALDPLRARLDRLEVLVHDIYQAQQDTKTLMGELVTLLREQNAVARAVADMQSLG